MVITIRYKHGINAQMLAQVTQPRYHLVSPHLIIHLPIAGRIW